MCPPQCLSPSHPTPPPPFLPPLVHFPELGVSHVSFRYFPHFDRAPKRAAACTGCTREQLRGGWGRGSVEGTAQPSARSQQHRPGSPGCPGTQPRIQCSPWDRQRPGRAQGSKDTPAASGPELCRSSAPAPEHPGPCRLRAPIGTAGADSRAGEKAADTVVVPPGASQDKQPPLSHAPGRRLSTYPKCSLTPENQHSRPLTQKTN
ncbi:hypothetical protein VULLAG_LOCUS8157 [Vulpes lagopus]